MPLRTTSWSSTRTTRSGMVPTSRLFSQKAANPEYRRSYVRGDHRPCGWRRRSHSVKSIFIRYYVELAHPRAALEQALLSAPANLIPGIATFADDRGQHLLAEVGFPVDGHRVSKNVQIDVGAPVASTNRTWIPITWRATGPSGLFPVLDAELEFASLGDELTQVSLSGRYQPPLGLLGRTIDKALLSRVAEATIKDFVDRLARALEAAVPVT